MTPQRLSVAAAVTVFCGFVFTGCAGGQPPATELTNGPMVSIDPKALVTDEDLELLGEAGYQGDGMTAELMELTTALTTRYQGSDAFSGFEWSRDTRQMTLWWHGPVPAELDELLASVDPPITVEQTVNPPGRLRAVQQRLMAAGAVPGITVSAVSVSIDCSRLQVMAEPADPSTTPAEMTTALEAFSGYPVAVEIGSVVPISGVPPAVGVTPTGQ
ncbi:hypothetical protein [Agromyces badenianii]|uniref:hypothetical protein n=1 Tax=Agromyces badenianii TaxID=2080742 RepID=UPI001059493B|nr:hypothetical protein [Agromyces badenianii]